MEHGEHLLAVDLDSTVLMIYTGYQHSSDVTVVSSDSQSAFPVIPKVVGISALPPCRIE